MRTGSDPWSTREVGAVGQVVRFCEAVDGAKLAYAVLGRGPAVLYVCGWPEHLELEWQQPFARAFLERMSRGCTLVRYDMRVRGSQTTTSTHLLVKQTVPRWVTTGRPSTNAPVDGSTR